MSKPDFAMKFALETLTKLGENPENCSTPEEWVKWADNKAKKIEPKYTHDYSIMAQRRAIIDESFRLIKEAIASNKTNCENCEDCRNCVRCFNCKGVMNCYNCIGCTYIMNCVNCINCKNPNNKSRHMNNVNCIECVDCMNCVCCINCSGLMNESYMVNNRKVTVEQFKAEFQKYMNKYTKPKLFGNTPAQLNQTVKEIILFNEYQ
jgi:hypothetical protein